MEFVKRALRQLFRKRGRTWLTVGGIAVGVMMVSIVTVVGNVGRSFVDEELNSMGVSGLSVIALTPDVLLSETALSEIRDLPQVASAMPLMLQLSNITTPKGESEAVLCGIDAGAGQVISLTLCHGRMISKGDVSSAASVCVVDESAARAAYGRENAVGKTLEVKVGDYTETLRIVGVTKTGSSLLQNVTSLIPEMVYLPYTTEQKLTGREDFDQIAVRTTNSDTADRALQRINGVLDRLYDGAPVFRTDNLAVQKDRLERLVDIVAAVLTVISGVSLVVSGFGIMTVMLSSVSERTREIGIKKAIGATGGRILAEFLIEAVVLSLAGTLLGLLPAILLLLVVKAAVPLSIFVLLSIFSVGVGVVFGVYPAYKASKLPPVEALRNE